jgi:hypothetical protein
MPRSEPAHGYSLLSDPGYAGDDKLYAFTINGR